MFRVPFLPRATSCVGAAALAVVMLAGGTARAADLPDEYGRYGPPYARGYEPAPRYVPRGEFGPYAARPPRRVRGPDYDCRVVERPRLDPYGGEFLERRRVCVDANGLQRESRHGARPRYRGEEYAARGYEPRYQGPRYQGPRYEPRDYEPGQYRAPRPVVPDYAPRPDVDDED